MDNAHVAEPFRSALKAMGGGSIAELQSRSERMTIDLARKMMANDVLRAMVAAMPNGARAQVDAVIAICDAEARK